MITTPFAQPLKPDDFYKIEETTPHFIKKVVINPQDMRDLYTWNLYPIYSLNLPSILYVNDWEINNDLVGAEKVYQLFKNAIER